MAKDDSVEIVGYMHVCMVNHWMDIVTEQLDIIRKSGLYDRVSKIKMCALGPSSELIKLIRLARGKIEIVGHLEAVDEYEYITLNALQKDLVEKDAYCFYIHTKGCSYPNNSGGKYWVDYMNYYNLERWRDAVNCLDIGYETYGVKLLSEREKPAYSMHYSGNFFWSKSSYVNTLIDVNSLDKSNRGHAEMWLCSNHPIAATGCQEFVDYNTKGCFTPFKIESNV